MCVLCCTGTRFAYLRPPSEDRTILPNSSLSYYGRISSAALIAAEQGYVDFATRGVFAGFGSLTGIEDYSKIAIRRQTIIFSLSGDVLSGSSTRIPGYFPMLGGASFGPNALVNIIKSFGWKRVASYYQNAASEVVQAEEFSALAAGNGISFEMQQRESAGAIDSDLQNLKLAKSNIFIFFGGGPFPTRCEQVDAPIMLAAMPQLQASNAISCAIVGFDTSFCRVWMLQQPDRVHDTSSGSSHETRGLPCYGPFLDGVL
jgi:hypothetical protein